MTGRRNMASKRTKKASAEKPQSPPAEASVSVPAEHHPETHSFAYRDGSSCMTCLCGAEQELRLVDGKAARMYRLTSTAAWGRAIDVCAKYVPPAPPKVEKPKARKEAGNVLGGFTAALKEQYPEVFASEIVDGSDVEKTAEIVDLSVACSPVLPHRAPRDPLSGMGDTLNPVECSPLGGDMYRVYYVEGPRDVSADEVRVMRARFLLRKGELSRALIEKDGDPVVKERWMKLYGITYLPPAGSPLATMMQGRVGMISIPGNAQRFAMGLAPLAREVRPL